MMLKVCCICKIVYGEEIFEALELSHGLCPYHFLVDRRKLDEDYCHKDEVLLVEMSRRVNWSLILVALADAQERTWRKMLIDRLSNRTNDSKEVATRWLVSDLVKSKADAIARNAHLGEVS